ncbi:MAG: lasso RiPP family leader peptide-containing protein [Erythrobacter sp.]
MTETIKKIPYETPRLITFGSVRNLTGGSFTRFRDGALQNSRF